MECKGTKRKPENTTLKRKKQKLSEIEEGEVGIIESVTVQNFMCHENLSLSFGPHVNFIIGQNGSGKSAILTAIILALGGKSSSTDRFTNIKGFVKNGKHKGKVEVVLRNRGPLSYKRDTYGEKIIVVREFNKDGVSSYKIKSESGTICSTQKNELNVILETMNIMVECPVCVLTQANSKKFLISKDAKAERLYEFFYKGAGLEALEKNYEIVRIDRENAIADLERKKEVLPTLRKELAKWKKFLDSSKRIHNYRNEHIWAGVIEMERIVEEKKEELLKIEKGLEEHKKNLEGCKKSYLEKNSELNDLTNQKKDLDTEMGNCRKQLEELKKDLEGKSKALRENKGTLHKLESAESKIKDDILGMKKCINEQKMKNQKHVEEEEKKRQKAIQILKDNNSILKDALTNLNEKINTSRNEQSNFDKSIRSLSEEVNQHKYTVKRINFNLENIRNAAKSKVNAFGDHTERVLQEIERNKNSFRKRPVGPIGMYLKVRNPSWAAVIERAVGGFMLNSFCVDNHEDCQLLKNILRKFYSRIPSIIVSQYEPQIFDVRKERVQSSFPAILDMLEIKSHIVANCLIDQTAIEKKILVEDESAVTFLMNNRPLNCYSAYLMNCDEICYNPSRYYSCSKTLPRSRLRAIREEDISNLQKEKDEELAAIGQLEKQIQVMEKERESIPRKIKGLEGEVINISTKLRKNVSEMREWECREEPKDVDCMKEELQVLEQSYDETLREIQSVSREIAALESIRLEIKKQLDHQSDLLKSLNGKYQKLLEKIGAVSKLKESFASGKTKYEAELKAEENEYMRCLRIVEDKQGKLQVNRSNAESICPRIDTDRTCEEISRLINETQKVVEAQSKCDRKEIHIKYKEKLESLKKAENEQKSLEQTLEKIGNMLDHRLANFHRIRINTELLIDLTFKTLLSGNGYSGHLAFDQVNKTLKLIVSPRAGDKARKNHSSLSGGERSFVTIVFLLALWGRTKMPFRILDEYDVFMDSNNRQLSIDLLCRKAIEMARTQFVFLSPLDQPRLPPEISKYVETVKMAAPKRKTADEDSPRKKRS